MKIFNKSTTKEYRKRLRNNQTEAEKLFWEEVRCKRILGLKFRRQYGIGEYIVDFYCPKIKLAVEIDGENHFTEENKGYDQVRTEFINSLDISVIRFTNMEIKFNIDEVLRRLKKKIREKN